VAERFRFTDGRVDRIPPPPEQSASEEGHHIHVHFDIADAIMPRNGTPRVSRRDNAGDPGEETSVRRNGLAGQGEVPEEEERGALICRISQSGEDGSWSGRLADDGGPDGQGTPLHIRSAATGLEIYHALAQSNGDQADPDIVGEHPAPNDPGAAHDRRQRRLGARALDALTRTGFCEDPYMASAEYAIRMREAFAKRRS
jgi:hypothetical protein